MEQILQHRRPKSFVQSSVFPSFFLLLCQLLFQLSLSMCVNISIGSVTVSI